MNQIINNKKYDDINGDLPSCNCNLCWITRLIYVLLPNNIIFRNTFVLFIIVFILPSIFFTVFYFKTIYFIYS